MRFRFTTVALTSALLGAAHAEAQNAAQPDPVWQITTFELDPATSGSWREAVRLITVAAKEMDLPSAKDGWRTVNRGTQTMMIRPRTRDSLFVGGLLPSLRREIAARNPARDAEIQKLFDAGRVLGMTTEIWEAPRALDYRPPAPLGEDQVHAMVYQDYTIAQGQMPAFRAAMIAVQKIYAEMKYPYLRTVSFARFGATNRARLVTRVDNLENYYGKNSVDRLLEGNPSTREALAAARQALQKTMTGRQETTAVVAADLSYPRAPR